MQNNWTNNFLPNEQGFYGQYGGQFVPENLKSEFEKITNAFLELKNDKSFNDELAYLLKHFVGRPSPIYFAKNLSLRTSYGVLGSTDERLS